MYRIVPLPILPADVLASNVVTETEVLPWDSGTTYVAGDFAYSEASHMIYVCLAYHTNSDPDQDGGQYWEAYEATNFWRAFDQDFGTITRNPASIVYDIVPRGFISVAAFDGVQGHSVRVEVLEPDDTPVFDSGLIKMLDFGDPFPANIWEYCTAEPTVKTQHIVTGFEVFGPNRVRVSVLSYGEAQVARIVLAPLSEALGNARPGTAPSLENLSTLKFDDFGKLRGTGREKLQQTDFVWQVPIGTEGALLRKLAARLDQPTLYTTSLTDQGRGTMVFGISEVEPMQLPSRGVTEIRMRVTGAA